MSTGVRMCEPSWWVKLPNQPLRSGVLEQHNVRYHTGLKRAWKICQLLVFLDAS